MPTNFADRLLDAIDRVGVPACVGLDPMIQRLPAEILEDAGLATGAVTDDAPVDATAAAGALREFCREVISLVAPLVPVVKVNIAFFEKYRAEGVRAYFDVVKEAHDAGLIVIGDVKRADIGHSSAQYAAAQLGPSGLDTGCPDAVTVNPYFGYDGVRPFVDAAKEHGRGVFVLVQTSNESAADVQGLALSDGSTLGASVASLVQRWASAKGLIGGRGYSCVGAVVSPRDVRATEQFRTLMPNCLFLVPGFGAQGRTTDEVAKCFKPDGTGAVVTASRSVTFAFDRPDERSKPENDWRRCIEQACRDLVEAIRRASGR